MSLLSLLQQAHQVGENWDGFVSAIRESTISVDYHRTYASVESTIAVCFGQISNMYGMGRVNTHAFERNLEYGTRRLSLTYGSRGDNVVEIGKRPDTS